MPAEGVFDESCAKLDELGQPRFLVVSFTAEMSMVARILWKFLHLRHDDRLEPISGFQSAQRHSSDPGGGARPS